MIIRLKFREYPTVFDNLCNEYFSWKFSFCDPDPTITFLFWLNNILKVNIQPYDNDFLYDKHIIFESEEDMFLFLMEWS